MVWVRSQVEDGQQGDISPEGQVRGGLRENCYIWQLRWPSRWMSVFVCFLDCTMVIVFFGNNRMSFPLNSRGSGGLMPHRGTRGGHVTQTWHMRIFMSASLIVLRMGMGPKLGHQLSALGLLLALPGKKYSFLGLCIWGDGSWRVQEAILAVTLGGSARD